MDKKYISDINFIINYAECQGEKEKSTAQKFKNMHKFPYELFFLDKSPQR
jgi:hypothetical protein